MVSLPVTTVDIGMLLSGEIYGAVVAVIRGVDAGGDLSVFSVLAECARMTESIMKSDIVALREYFFAKFPLTSVHAHFRSRAPGSPTFFVLLLQWHHCPLRQLILVCYCLVSFLEW